MLRKMIFWIKPKPTPRRVIIICAGEGVEQRMEARDNIVKLRWFGNDLRKERLLKENNNDI
jgi:hypothetical protein